MCGNDFCACCSCAVGLLGEGVSAVMIGQCLCQRYAWEGGNVRGTQLLDAQLGQPRAHVDTLLDGLALGQTGKETTGEGVTGTGGVGNLVLANDVDGESLDVVVALDGNDGGLGALGDDDSTLALGVLLGQVGHVLGDGGDVLGLEVVGLSEGASLGLVADDVVPVGGGLVELVLEELADEGSGEREHEDLVLGSGLLGEGQDGGDRDGQVVTTDKVDLGLLDEVPVLLQVLDLVAVGSSEIGAHATVVASDDDTAATGGLFVVVTVDGAETDLLVGLDELLGVLVLANASNKDNRLGGKDVLGTSGGVLGGATGVQVDLEVLEQVLVEAHVLLFGQDGVVGLESILLEQLLVADGLDVQEGVLETEDFVLARHFDV
jgi:hypothetical protein